ncbi:MAG: hypothetical protein HC769_06895 [Cyanobacteria bacterium CRU_2_1]|nr:hypothetical protein [Cyanobacteria bacterium RU_5_0]NJR58602.1 hypothetical protein [Cyanobacteria bacterium CRU_2_1]
MQPSFQTEPKELDQTIVSLLPSRPNEEANPGSMMASLWLTVSQDSQPPASIPSTLVPLEICPKCGDKLAPPLKSSGRQVCSCGWVSRSSRNTAIGAATEESSLLADDELRRLLNQAAAESIKNMKPRKKPT